MARDLDILLNFEGSVRGVAAREVARIDDNLACGARHFLMADLSDSSPRRSA